MAAVNFFNIAALLFAFCCGIYRYKILDDAAKIFAVFVCLSVVSENLAFFAAQKFRNNMPVYAIYSLIEFGMVSLYFNNAIDVFRRYNIGYYVGIAGIILGILNIAFLQGLNQLNSYFLVFEGICIIGMALFSFFRLLLKHDQLRLNRYHHFWFATILAFFWSVTFINWSLYDYFSLKFTDKMWIINASIIVVNIITYLAISSVFILYPKMQRNNER